MKNGYLYMMSNQKNGPIYTGVTSDLVKRVYEHKSKVIDGFTKRYGLESLVYYEIYESIEAAIHREKCIKKYPRAWKINLIQSMNSDWNDLYPDILGLPDSLRQR